MPDFLLLVLLISPLATAGVLAFLASQSLLSIFGVMLGAGVGAVSIALSGIFWLQVLHRSWMESQAAGFILLPVILPFYGYIGGVAGASLVSMLYGFSRGTLSAFVFQAIAIGGTVVLGGFIPAAIAALPSFQRADPARAASQEVETFAVVPIFAICIFAICAGLISSWLASQLASLLVGQIVAW